MLDTYLSFSNRFSNFVIPLFTSVIYFRYFITVTFLKTDVNQFEFILTPEEG